MDKYRIELAYTDQYTQQHRQGIDQIVDMSTKGLYRHFSRKQNKEKERQRLN